jgi:tRNA nucleotidyltransferase (CCA-adding enzyme)
MKTREIALERPWKPHPALEKLLTVLVNKGGRSLLVGGCVRDFLLGLEAKDIDLEVYNISHESLERCLNENFQVISAGKSFGIFKVIVEHNKNNYTFDVSVPRADNKIGKGHKAFSVSYDPQMSFYDASSRRDFTVNAMAIDVKKQLLLDAHGGLDDLKHKKLRHISPSFSEDPLRVLRAAQFCARFAFELCEQTKELCKKLKAELKTLSQERIYEEMKKLLLAKTPSLGLKVLKETESLELFPELKALINCAQDPLWHPEGDVWTHTLLVIDQAAKLSDDLEQDEKLIVMAGALCHDLGKPQTTALIDGRIKSIGHDQEGVEPTLSFLNRMGFPLKYHDDVAALVREHLKPYQLYAKKDEVSDGAIKRLILRVNIRSLLRVSQADFLGRTTQEAQDGIDPSASWLSERIEKILGKNLSIRPLLLGRHLIQMGLKPGPKFKNILNMAFEAQLDNIFTTEEEALLWLKDFIKREAS